MSATIDTGHTAWILVCMALVQLMLPGLAFFYAGLLSQKSVVTMIIQNYACMGVITVLWFMFAFSLCFGHTYSFYGSITTFGMFKDVEGSPLAHTETSDHSAGVIISDIPGLVFAGYQGMFAVITPALMTGAFADRIYFGPYLVFVALWLLLVYCPFCHAIWGPDGWLGKWDIKDFAGGIVVHCTAGFSALAAVHYLGPRNTILGKEPDNSPHNIPFVALGTALLWFGWFGFNGGSALGSGASAAFAAVNTEIAASTALCVWTAIEWARNGKPSLVGMCVGAIAGLATITPAAGFIRPWAAFLIGFLAGGFCYGCCELKNRLKWDDALDVWGVHGMGGALGSILLGILADKDVGGVDGSGEFLGKQTLVVFGCAAYSYLITYALLAIMGLVCPLKPTAEEMADLDSHFHGEEAYTPSTKAQHSLKADPNLDSDSKKLDLDGNITPTPEVTLTIVPEVGSANVNDRACTNQRQCT
jgi:Amt family ammonium transporter